MKNHPENIFSDEDLERSAPLLFDLKKKITSDAGFSTPQGYFDSLSSEVMNKIESIPDFETQANINPFNTPEGYFDSLPSIIQQRIIDENKKKSVWESIAGIFSSPVPKYALAFASIFFFLFFSVKYFTRTIHVDYVQETQSTEQLESIYLSQIDESVLWDAYTEQPVIAVDAQQNEIENYLIDNNIDLNLISEHL
jgi:hypothetical protein